MSTDFWNTPLSKFATGQPVPRELDMLCRELAAGLRERSPGEVGDALPAVYLRIADHLRRLEAGDEPEPLIVDPVGP